MSYNHRAMTSAIDLINQSLLPYARERQRLNGLGGSVWHGVPHWYNVWLNFMALAEAHDKPIDPHIGALFAIFHDMERKTEDVDSYHGHRAADHLLEIWDESLFPFALSTRFTDETLGGAMVAIRHHNLGGTMAADSTVACCWDADRLDLVRMGISTDPKLLSTRAGKAATSDTGRQAHDAHRDALARTHGMSPPSLLDPVEGHTQPLRAS